MLVRKGLTTVPIAGQKHYELADLILAIVAHDNVEYGEQMSFPTREMISIYLHEFDASAVAEAVDRLIEAGHAGPYEFGLEKGVVIRGEGLQYYQEEVCQRLNLEPDQGILQLTEPIEFDSRFGRLGLEPALVANLQQRWREMEICAAEGAYLAAIILLGSILEGVLLATLHRRITDAMRSPMAPKERSSKTVKMLTDWTLQEYISVSTDIGLVPRSVEKHVHELRDTRNLVHPHKQWTSGIAVDQPLYRISRQVADAVIDELVIP